MATSRWTITRSERWSVATWVALTVGIVAWSRLTEGIDFTPEARTAIGLGAFAGIAIIGARPLLHWILEDGPRPDPAARQRTRRETGLGCLFWVVTFVLWLIPFQLLVGSEGQWTFAYGAAWWIWLTAWSQLTGLLERAFLGGPASRGGP